MFAENTDVVVERACLNNYDSCNGAVLADLPPLVPNWNDCEGDSTAPRERSHSDGEPNYPPLLSNRLRLAEAKTSVLEKFVHDIDLELEKIQSQRPAEHDRTIEIILQILCAAILDGSLTIIDVAVDVLAAVMPDKLLFQRFGRLLNSIHSCVTSGRLALSADKSAVNWAILSRYLRSDGGDLVNELQAEILTRMKLMNCSADLQYVAYATGDNTWLNVSCYWDAAPLSLRTITVSLADLRWLGFTRLYMASPPDLRWVAVYFRDPRWLYFHKTWANIPIKLRLHAICCANYDCLRTTLFEGARFDLTDATMLEKRYLVPVKLRGQVCTQLINRCIKCPVHCPPSKVVLTNYHRLHDELRDRLRQFEHCLEQNEALRTEKEQEHMLVVHLQQEVARLKLELQAERQVADAKLNEVKTQLETIQIAKSSALEQLRGYRDHEDMLKRVHKESEDRYETRIKELNDYMKQLLDSKPPEQGMAASFTRLTNRNLELEANAKLLKEQIHDLQTISSAATTNFDSQVNSLRARQDEAIRSLREQLQNAESQIESLVAVNKRLTVNQERPLSLTNSMDGAPIQAPVPPNNTMTHVASQKDSSDVSIAKTTSVSHSPLSKLPETLNLKAQSAPKVHDIPTANEAVKTPIIKTTGTPKGQGSPVKDASPQTSNAGPKSPPSQPKILMKQLEKHVVPISKIVPKPPIKASAAPQATTTPVGNETPVPKVIPKVLPTVPPKLSLLSQAGFAKKALGNPSKPTIDQLQSVAATNRSGLT